MIPPVLNPPPDFFTFFLIIFSPSFSSSSPPSFPLFSLNWIIKVCLFVPKVEIELSKSLCAIFSFESQYKVNFFPAKLI